MRKISYSLFIAGGMLFLASCKKQSPINTANTTTQSSKAIEVKQKIVVADHSTIVNKVKEFKNIYNQSSTLSKTTSSQNMPIDSALWLLETVLNYDFDTNTYQTNYTDSTGYVVNLSSQDTITTTELNNAYLSFYNYISQKISPNNQVKVIDIYAYYSNNTLVISSSVIFASPAAGNKTESVCDPYSNITARWSYPLTNTPPFTYCTNYTTNNDGPTLCNIKLNCTQYNPPCNPYFYTNVVTLLFDNMNNNYPNALFYYSTYSGSPSVVCNPPALTDAQLNNYISGCKNLGISNVPATPGYIITNYNISATYYFIPPAPAGGGSGFSILWWYMNVTYAIPTCNGGGN